MSRRKLLRDSMTVLGVFGVLGGAGKVLGVFDSMTADFATDIGKRRQIVLEDSSLLTLDGGSAVDIDFDGGERAVRLIKGRLFVSVAHDVNRPFIIYTRDGACKSLGTEFGVGLGAEGTRLAVTRSAVQAQAASGGALNVKAGQVATLLRSGRINLEPLQADAESTWVKGFITAVDRPLSEIVEALNRYLPGLIVLSEDAASLRISGLFLLDDAQSSIRQIAQTLPVVVTYHTAYLIRISLDSVGRSSST
ncbi:hypothetical protein AN416_37865 (plasmid) [Paraburkholderia caribensis]|nr:hypothetical protein AN416_37865 [Paraburkholderia caribensis]